MTHPPQYPQPQYMVVQRPPSNGVAIGAMVLGIIAIAVGIWAPVPFLGFVAAVLGFAPAVVAVILGHMGMSKASRMGGTGRGQAVTGLILGYITVAIIAAAVTFWFVAVYASNAS